MLNKNKLCTYLNCCVLFKAIFFIDLAIVSPQAQTDIHIAGTISDNHGLPVNRALVRLVKSNVSTFSDSTGHYILAGVTKLAYTGTRPMTSSVSIRSQTLILNLDQNANTVIDIFDLNGCCLSHLIHKYLSAGMHNIPFNKTLFPTKTYILNIRIGNVVSIVPIIPLITNSTLHPVLFNKREKRCGTVPSFFDTVVVTDSGYFTHKQPVSRSIDSIDFIILKKDSLLTKIEIICDSLEYITPVISSSISIAAPSFDTTIESEDWRDTFELPMPLGMTVSITAKIYGINSEQIGLGKISEYIQDTVRFLTVLTKPSLSVSVNDIDSINQRTTTAIQGKIESGMAINYISCGIFDSSDQPVLTKNLNLQWIKNWQGSLIDLQTSLDMKVVAQDGVCSGIYFLTLIVSGKDTTITIRRRFIVVGENCSYTNRRDTLIAGSLQNSIYGASLDLDAPYVYLVAEASNNVPKIDLIYSYSGIHETDKFFAPVYAVHQSGFTFCANWTGESTIYFIKIYENIFDTLETQESIKYYWDSYTPQTDSVTVFTGNVFIVKTDQNALVMMKAMEMAPGNTGWIKLAIKK